MKTLFVWLIQAPGRIAKRWWAWQWENGWIGHPYGPKREDVDPEWTDEAAEDVPERGPSR